jgi:glucan phosphoethanolaminetransferase (alkaline phosphatase superfamily)
MNNKIFINLLSLAKVLDSWRHLASFLALIGASLLIASLVFYLPAIERLQVPLILITAWGLLGYFYIASFSKISLTTSENLNWLQRIKHKLANFFIKLFFILFVALLAITTYLTYRLLTVWLV